MRPTRWPGLEQIEANDTIPVEFDIYDVRDGVATARTFDADEQYRLRVRLASTRAQIGSDVTLSASSNRVSGTLRIDEDDITTGWPADVLLELVRVNTGTADADTPSAKRELHYGIAACRVTRVGTP